MIDTHAHLNDPKFGPDLDLVVERSNDAGVQAIVVCGYDIDSSLRAVEIARRHSRCFATAGVHPHDSRKLAPTDIDRLREISALPEVIAIGETGLDFHYNFSPRASQIAAFEQHIELAREVGLPLVMHSRESHEEAVSVLKSAGVLPEGVFHCFSGSRAQAEEVLEMGFYKNAKTLKDVVSMCPLDRLLIETDCPYMAPVPHRGKRNEPAFLPFICQEISNIKGIDPREAAQITSSNARRLFRRLP